MLNARDQGIFEEFCGKIRERFPEARIYAFGSRVRGDYEADSDLDVCVVTRDLDDAVREFISDAAWEVGFAHDLLINTVVFTIEGVEHGPWQASPLYKAILQEGVAA